jgi:two-component system sensor histidine kinase KdpD
VTFALDSRLRALRKKRASLLIIASAASAWPVTISAETAGEGVVVSVSDRGPGIPAGSEQEVFRKFYRGSGVGAGGAEGGSGLGLTICRGIVQAHGGRIWAERCDDGVTFRFLLPIGGLPMPPVPVEAGS